jgi:hypothetical protein
MHVESNIGWADETWYFLHLLTGGALGPQTYLRGCSLLLIALNPGKVDKILYAAFSDPAATTDGQAPGVESLVRFEVLMREHADALTALSGMHRQIIYEQDPVPRLPDARRMGFELLNESLLPADWFTPSMI